MTDEDETEVRDVYDSLSPLDYRYWDEDVARHLSENGFTRAKLRVEVALVKSLAARGLCSSAVVAEIEAASKLVKASEVYAEEKKTRHDVRALVNQLRARVSDEAKPFVHMTATSYDIVDTANALRFRETVYEVLLPALRNLEKELIVIADREAGRIQIGRTHGQHAVPITFGFAIASYVDRLGNSIREIDGVAIGLRGKFSGAVGAYNASSLFFKDPEEFEREVLAELGLEPAEHSTQIVPPEPMIRLLLEAGLAMGIMANLSRDMRNLQRTEIGEVGEDFEAKQVGSSTMTQKRNPINFENAESMWKIVRGRLATVLEDQVSEHQRDLTGSASMRTYGEIIAYVVGAAKRLTRTMAKLRVDPVNMQKNLAISQGLIAGEPLYILLAGLGHPNAHEKSRTLTLQAQAEHEPLEKVIFNDKELEPWLEKMTPDQKRLLRNPAEYVGIAPRKARTTVETWQKRLPL